MVNLFPLAAAVAACMGPAYAGQPDTAKTEKLPMVIPVLVVTFLPVDGDKIDRKITGDCGDTYVATKAKCERLTNELAQHLENGSRYHGYKDKGALPSLRYPVLDSIEFKRAMPLCPLSLRTRSRRRFSIGMNLHDDQPDN